MTTFPIPTDPTKPTVLRRATYVHVCDLTSAYNIDHALLEQELSRVRAERNETNLPKKETLLTEAEGELDVTIGQTTQQKRLQPPRGGYNLCVLVGKVNVVVDKRRVDRSRVRLAEVEIGDETGTVSLRARDEQIDVLEQVSARSGAVVLRNCTLELYQGKHIRLAVTKWGKLCVYPDNVPSTPAPPSKMNNDKDFSLIDLSLVASEMVDLHPEGTQNSRQNRSLSDSTDGGRNQGSSKSGGNNSKQKNGRNRRGGKSSGGGNQSHYGGPPRDIGAMSSQSNQRIYQSMHTYPGYDERLDMRQYPSYQPDVITPESAQLILQQQYQFQQMYAHRSTDHLPSNMGQLQSPGMLFQPVSSPPPGSYNYTTRGASPTMPVDVRSIQTGSLMQTPTNPHQYNAMNPDATAFAPNYLNPQGHAPAMTYFPPYDPRTSSVRDFHSTKHEGSSGKES